MEPICNFLKRCSSKKDGKPRDHEAIHESVTIMTHSSGGKDGANTLCRGVADHLVDIGKGCKKCDNDGNKKRYKLQHGKVIIRKDKGKDRKHNIPLIINTDDVRNASVDMNKI